MIKVVYKKPSEEASVLEIENTLEKFQELVGGYIEIISLGEIYAIVNEDAISKNLKENVVIKGKCILGNIVFALNKNDDDFHSLTNDKIKSIMEILN